MSELFRPVNDGSLKATFIVFGGQGQNGKK